MHANFGLAWMTRALPLLAVGCLLAAPSFGDEEEKVSGCKGGLATRLVPLPVWATLPNEGSTYGVMPVFILVCDETQRTDSIVAPSVTYNDVIHYTGTLRWFHYPSDEKSLTVILSASTR